jgi:Tfp pilus assembly protein PilX
MSLLFTRLFLNRLMTAQPARKERGDVPGWVLITVMTAGLVVAIWAVAGPQLQDMLQRALDSVGNK